MSIRIIICAVWTITDAVCLSARPSHWRQPRLYDIRRKRSWDYAYGRGRLNEKNERKKNTRNNNNKNSLVWRRCSPCTDRGIRRLFHVPVWSRPINFGNTFRIESVSVPALNKNVNVLNDGDLSAMLY